MIDIQHKPHFSQLFNKASLEQLMQEILAEAKRQGATSAEVDVAVNKGFSVHVRKGEPETVEYNQDKVIGVTVYLGKRSGSASLSDLRPEAIRSAVQAAYNIARFTDEDECSGLAEKDLLAFDFVPADIDYPWDITVPQAIELMQECEALALAQDKRIIHSDGVALSTIEVWNGYGNSHGFLGAYPVTRHEMNCILVAKQKEEMQRDYSYTISCDASQLDSVKDMAHSAAEKTLQRLGARRLPTCKVPVLFVAEVARSLLGHFVSAISGSSLYRKSSFLLDHMGKKIFPDHIQIQEQPFLAKSLGSAPFDDDGVRTRANVFIENGILSNYALGTYSARKLKMQSTGNAGGVHNLIINTGKLDLQGLIKKMGRGLLVTEFLGSGVNLMTGDYSRGVCGLWIENGEIQFPVEEITIAGKLQDMYANLVDIGCDVDKRGNIQTGSILLNEMSVAGE